MYKYLDWMAHGFVPEVLKVLGRDSSMVQKASRFTTMKCVCVCVVDANNNRVQVFDPDGKFQRIWGSYGAGAGDFKSPSDVAVHSYEFLSGKYILFVHIIKKGFENNNVRRP